VTLQGGRIVPVFFDDIIDPATGRTRIRNVETDTETYEVARKYMIRLEEKDFSAGALLDKMVSLTNLGREAFVERYLPAARW